jgi:hypothetical protein
VASSSPPSISLLYGPTGSPDLSSRFAIEGEPFAAVPITIGGTVSNTPAHEIGLSGGAYRYGGTVVNGTKNLIPISNAHATLPPFSANFGSYSFDLGKVAGTNSPFHCPLQTLNTRYLYQVNATMMSDGEVIGNGTPAGNEIFTTAGTVTITNGNATITGSGTAWTTNTLAATYAYTPALNAIQRNDVIQVTHPTSGTVYYRIKTVTDATHLVVFPTPAETTASGCAYTILRTGYGSYSRVVPITEADGTIWFYYAGMQYFSPYPLYPTLMAFNASASPTHQMGPTGIQAADIAYYKSYLLYGYGSSIGWSVPGFPTTFPFASADLPASSITVITAGSEDRFISFEYLGDQLIALFMKSIWIVQQNPGQTQANAFSFYKLPEVQGTLSEFTNKNYADVATTWAGDDLALSRPSCSADGAVYYLSAGGVMELTGTSGANSISSDVDDILPHAGTIHWDQVTDSLIVEQFSDPMFVYSRPSKAWYLSTWKKAFGTSDNTSSAEMVSRSLRWTYYDGTSIKGTLTTGSSSVLDRPYASPTDAWSWASPIVNLSDIYPQFTTGGLRIDCEAPGLTTANITISVYGGRSPYSMLQQGSSFTYNAAIGTPSARDMINFKVDFPFVAVTLSGTTRLKPKMVWLYQTNTKARK